MYAKKRAYKNLNKLTMNTTTTYFSNKLMAFGLTMICFIGISCTSLQQTTVVASDDLYAIPSTTATTKTYAKTDNRNQEQVADEQGEYQDYQNYQDDRYLRLKVANRYRWSGIDDFGYWNDPRFNYAYYPSYLGWNSWYSGFYGASWYNPFGAYSMGWGGYNPYFNSFAMGWGFNDFGFGIGYGGFGYGGFGYGGFGYGGMGYGGWNPYYAGYWNPYGPVFMGGGIERRRPYLDPRQVHTSAPGLAAYTNRSINNVNRQVNTTNGNIRYSSNPDLNNNFGNLIKRVVTNNSNVNQANSFDRPSRTFNNNNFSNTRVTSTPSTSNTVTPSSNSNSNAGGRSGGYNSAGSSSSGSRPSRVN
jgi:hypothetical protein